MKVLKKNKVRLHFLDRLLDEVVDRIFRRLLIGRQKGYRAILLQEAFLHQPCPTMVEAGLVFRAMPLEERKKFQGCRLLARNISS
jgi:hypothetical protein